jgi:hypothetical protein
MRALALLLALAACAQGGPSGPYLGGAIGREDARAR